MSRIKVFGVFVLVFGSVTSADCLDRVKQVWVNPNGMVQFRTEKKCPNATCMLSGFSTEATKQAFAALLTAQATTTQVLFQFNENPDTGCVPTNQWQYPVKEFRVGAE